MISLPLKLSRRTVWFTTALRAAPGAFSLRPVSGLPWRAVLKLTRRRWRLQLFEWIEEVISSLVRFGIRKSFRSLLAPTTRIAGWMFISTRDGWSDPMEDPVFVVFTLYTEVYQLMSVCWPDPEWVLGSMIRARGSSWRMSGPQDLFHPKAPWTGWPFFQLKEPVKPTLGGRFVEGGGLPLKVSYSAGDGISSGVGSSTPWKSEERGDLRDEGRDGIREGDGDRLKKKGRIVADQIPGVARASRDVQDGVHGGAPFSDEDDWEKVSHSSIVDWFWLTALQNGVGGVRLGAYCFWSEKTTHHCSGKVTHRSCVLLVAVRTTRMVWSTSLHQQCLAQEKDRAADLLFTFPWFQTSQKCGNGEMFVYWWRNSG